METPCGSRGCGRPQGPSQLCSGPRLHLPRVPFQTKLCEPARAGLDPEGTVGTELCVRGTCDPGT